MAYFALSLGAMLVASWAPTQRFLETRQLSRSPIWILPVALTLCLLVYLPALSHEVNGSARWIWLNIPGGGFSIQPSEFGKWGAIALVAWFGAFRGEHIKRFRGGLVLGLAPIVLLAGVIMLEDLGTAVLIGAVAVVILLAAGARFWHVLMLTPLAVVTLVVGVVVEPYRIRRLTAFVDPYADPAGAGYHAIQSMAAVAGGDGFGRGLGFGLQKFGYLPEDQTDFIFAIISEELGIAGAALVISLYLGLLWSGWTIVRRERSGAMRLLGLGILMTIGLQAFINLAAVTGLGPTKGIALPLISSGGTGWVLTAAFLGILVGMDRRQTRQESSAHQPSAALA